MQVAVPMTAPLRKLDHFLRHIWLECCGHLSAFDIGCNRYASEAMEEELSMRAPLNKVFGVVGLTSRTTIRIRKVSSAP